jgi:menaquinol-cytochrome c reductase cytochrome b subunit
MFATFTDWLDVRLDIRRIYKEQFAFEIREGFSFWRIFGALTIGCIFIQIVTGIYMISYYIPEPNLAHKSIQDMCNMTSWGAIMRNSHRWSSTFAILFLFVHAVHVIARRAYRAPRELNWWTGLTLGVVFILLLITGVIMPWDWRSYWELVIWADWIDTIPIIGDSLKGPFLSWFTLGRNYAAHIFLLPGALFAVLGIHIYLTRRLGLSDKP